VRGGAASKKRILGDGLKCTPKAIGESISSKSLMRGKIKTVAGKVRFPHVKGGERAARMKTKRRTSKSTRKTILKVGNPPPVRASVEERPEGVSREQRFRMGQKNPIREP